MDKLYDVVEMNLMKNYLKIFFFSLSVSINKKGGRLGQTNFVQF